MQLAALAVFVVGMAKLPQLEGLWPLLVGTCGFFPLLYLLARVVPDPLSAPPKLPPALTWFTTAAWALFIFYSIPLARGFRAWITQAPPEPGQIVPLAERMNYGMGWDRKVFGYFVLACLLLMGLGVIKHLYRERARFGIGNYLGLAAILGLYTWEVFKIMDPNNAQSGAAEEAIHFVEYGVLAAVLFSALAHRHPNTAAMLGAIVWASCWGALDEVVQWMTPRRYFDLRDIRLNAFSATLIGLLFGLVLRPSYFTWKIPPRGVRMICKGLLGLLAIFAFIFANTPTAQEQVLAKLPYLRVYQPSWTEMNEFGYAYTHEKIGHFKSRLTPEQLRAENEARGAEAAEILMQFRGGYAHAGYSDYLKQYTALSDPFMHELRVHLFSRDRNLELRVPLRPAYEHFVLGHSREQVLAAHFKPEDPANEREAFLNALTQDNADIYRQRSTSAVREHNILHQYFGGVMQHYPDTMTEAWMNDLLQEQYPYDHPEMWQSKVSRSLVVFATQTQLLTLLALLTVVVLALMFCYGRDDADPES